MANELTKTMLAPANTLINAEDTVAYGERLKFSDLEQVSIIQDIKAHIDTVINQRGKLKIEQEWKDAIDLYDGNLEDKTFPYEQSHNLHVHITSMVCDILAEKVKKNTFVRPMMLAAPKPIMQKFEDFSVQKKERFVNDKAFGEMSIEEKLSLIFDDAIKLGSGIGKLKHTREIRTIRTLEVYEPTIEDLARFMDDFQNDKNELYRKNLTLLRQRIASKEKENLTVWIEKDEVVKFQPELEWVDPFNLYIDCYTKDLRFHRIIAEKISDIGWQQLESYFQSGYFDKENAVLLDDIKKKYYNQEEYKKRKYTLWECNVQNIKYKNKDVNAIVTFIDEMPNRLAKAISFPYITNEPNYVLYTIKDKRNSIYGTGLPTLLKATNVAINEFWNLQLDSAEFTIAPMMIGNISSPDFDPSTKKFGPAVVWWLGPNDRLQEFPNAKNLGESYRLLEYLHRYAEWLTGVSAYMAGQAAPLDPRAPASKAYMLLQESNLRILSYIRKIDAANVKLFHQIDKLYYQYYNDSIKYFQKGENDEYISNDITRKELGVPVDWIPQLSDITINKALEKEENLKTAAYCQSQPDIMSSPKARRRINEIVIKGAGSIWEKSIPVLLPDLKETDVFDQIKQLMTKLQGPEGVMNVMAQVMQQMTPPESGRAKPQAAAAPAEATRPVALESMKGNIPNNL